MRHRFVTCDVFTTTRFGGNPLAVLPDAGGLTSAQMQQVAREFNLSETTFVLPAEDGHDARVRIFTPAREVPFAGHPNVGTAFVLASLGAVGPMDAPRTLHFEEAAGVVPVSIEPRGPGRYWCELRAPEALSLGPALPVERIAAAVRLEPADIVTETHVPVVASVGLPFVVAELADLAALARARPDTAVLEELASLGVPADVHLYVRTGSDHVRSGSGHARTGSDGPGAAPLRTRMFAPLDGVPEDPATGSANGALVGLLASLDPVAEGELRWRIGQGVEMGRPSILSARVRTAGGAVADVWIGGESVLVSEGTIEV